MLTEDSTTTMFRKAEQDDFVRHREFLEETIDPDFGLLDKLLQSETLTWREIADIKAKDTFYKRNAELLDLISKNRKFDCLISALSDTNQSHVVNYISADGEHRFEFGGCWPLTKEDLLTMRVNHGRLVEILDPCELVVGLFSADVITSRQKEFIFSKRSCTEQNETLLEIIRRRSLDDYKTMVDCLHASNQSHIAEILVQGGVVVRLHANLNDDEEDISDAEDEISSAMASMVGDRSMPEINRILQLTQIKCIAVKKGQSLIIYTHCGTAEELQQLHEMLVSGRLRDSVELLFNKLLIHAQKIAVTVVTIYDEDLEKGEKYFQDSSEGSRATLHRREEGRSCIAPSNTTVNDLHLELLDIILQKSYLHSVFIMREEQLREEQLREEQLRGEQLRGEQLRGEQLRGRQLQLNGRHRDELMMMISRLASVDFCWFQRINKSRFKKNIWNYLSEFYRTVDTVSAIMRTNQSYFVESIRCKEIVRQLRSTDCLTDLQTRLVSRKNLSAADKMKLVDHISNNNSDVMHLMRSVDDRSRRSTFIRCLHRTRHRCCRVVTEVIENGGAVVRATIRTDDTLLSRRSTEEELVKRLNDLRDETKRRSSETEKVISELKDEGDVEMIECHLERQRETTVAVAWIWCRSQMGLKKLQRMNEDGDDDEEEDRPQRKRGRRSSLVDALRRLSISQSSVPQTIRPRIINIDNDQFRKTVVVRPIIVDFTARLVVGKTEEVKGVTKLRSEVYALCRSISPSSANVIRVFDDRLPFRLLKEIDIKDITDPEDIGSSERENLLYVTDLGKKCVWKITREADDYPVIMKWSTTDLRWPYTLSVTSDGQLLMLNRGDPVSCLEVYGSDGELRRSIQLPREIQTPLHAVQTSSQNFIITHKRRKEEEEEEDAEDVEEEQKEKEKTGGKEKDREIWSVSEVTRDGQTVIRRFVSRQETHQLNNPCYISLDSDGGRVFVADTANNRVILFDSDLQWNRILCPTPDEGKTIFRSWRLFYDNETSQLIVGGLIRGVNVYTLSRI